jgi:hypothetical protein
VIARSEEQRFIDMCKARNFMAIRIGAVDSKIGVEHGTIEQLVQIDGVYGREVSLSINELRTVSEATLPELFG